MALWKLDELLALADRRGRAVPAFNVYNVETVMGVARAAEKLHAPVIMAMYGRPMDGELGELLPPVVKKAAELSHVPMALHLDHGANLRQVIRALRGGATGIMIDGSARPYAENAALTREVVDLCAASGVPVEGELGHVGTTKEEMNYAFTEPDEAARFAADTGVKALAVQVGTAHGRYKRAPKLDIERLRAIREATGLPLVLHGGSGVPDDQVRAAVSAGVRKVNFGTDLCYAFSDAVRAVSPEIVAVDLMMKEPVEAVSRFCEEKIRLLGAEGLYE